MFQKNANTRRPLLSHVTLLACLVSVGPAIFAQDPLPGSQSSNPPATSKEITSIDDRLSQKVSSFVFDGGTVDEYVETLKEIVGEPSLNIVIAENARRQRMPKVALEDVTTKSMLNLIQELCVDNDDNSLVNVELVGDFDREYIFIGSSGLGAQRIVRVFSIAGLKALKNQISEDTLLKAVDSVMSMNESKEVKIQIHAEASLLIAKGTMEELDLIQQTITQMTGGINAISGMGGGGMGGMGFGAGGADDGAIGGKVGSDVGGGGKR
jgi:hypothetical protein